MKRTILCAALVLAAAGSALAQDYKGQGRVIGVVTDEQGQPLAGVQVKLVCVANGQGFDVATDKDGKWVGAWIRKGAWNVDFSKVGFEPRKISVDIVESKRNPEIKIALKKVEGMVLTEDIETLLTKGNILFDEKKYADALAVYQDLIQKFPDVYIVWKNVGNSYFAMEKYPEAEAAYQKVLEKSPANADAMVLIANTYVNRGDTAKALEWYGKIDIDKINDPLALYNVGTNYYNNGKFQEAQRCYKRSVDLQANPDSLYQLGLACLNLQQNPDAIAAFEAYLKLDSESQRAGQVRGFLDYLKK